MSLQATLLAVFGSDLTIVNAARVSFAKESLKLDDKDIKLINYLVAHKHFAPLCHPQITFRVTAPIFVARQLAKHQVGAVWSEESRRYIDEPPQFFRPDHWRGRAKNVKQGSAGPVDSNTAAKASYVLQEVERQTLSAYNTLLEQGVAPEQARMVLPLSTCTTWIWTGSLQFFARVCQLRLDNHAQYESQLIAQQISNQISPYFPIAWSALLGPESCPPTPNASPTP